MASILETFAYLVFGGAIGWWVKSTFFAPVFEESDMAQLSREWKYHLDAHAKSMKGSVALTAPGALTEGYVRKGGQNPPPTVEQLARRPRPPAAFRPAK